MTATLDLLVWAQMNQPGGNPNFGGGAPQINTGGLIAAMAVPLVIGLLVAVFFVIVGWKIFTKAGEPGWAAIVPVYQWMIASKICGRGEVFGLLMLVPCVNFVILIMLALDLAKVFGKGAGFGVGLFLLFPIFGAILAFGDARYVGPAGRADDEDEEEPRPRRRRPADDDDEEEDRPHPRRRP